MLARLRLLQGSPDAALAILEPLLAEAEARGGTRRLIELLSLQALALRARGDGDGALRALQRALAMAAPEGFVRVFVEGGEAMAELLREASRRGIAVAYVGKLLAAYADRAPGPPHGAAKPSFALVEPLSDREHEVLRLVAAGLSNAAVARRLVISLSTVKGHTTSIYGKLAVHSRTQAVARAHALGLLRQS